MAQGMTCPVCGFWEESGMGERKNRKKTAKRGETINNVGRNK
jgi:hypothetical protein